MNIDRDEECGFCGMPRHAHWGGSRALVAGRCCGFKSTAETKLRAAAPEMLAALKAMVLNDRHTYRDCHKAAVAAIAKAEGRGDV